MTLPKPEHVTGCCGAKVQRYQDDGGAREGTCRDCDEPVCTDCAGLWEDDYSLEGDPGSYRWCGLSLCKDCHGERDYKRQRREQRNDSGV